ncbi:MAG: flagellar basal body P-ring formation chaperone FlgA [Acidobacteriota bacterium]
MRCKARFFQTRQLRIWGGLSILSCAGVGMISGLFADTVRISHPVEVNTDRLVLSDIAEVRSNDLKLSQVALGYAPYPGHYRWLTKSDIERLLQESGFDVGTIQIDMEDRVLITRKSRILPKEKIRKSAASFLKAHWPDLDLSIQEMQLPRVVVLPIGETELQFGVPKTPVNLDNVGLKVSFRVNGKHWRSQWVRLRLTAHASLQVANRAIPYGHRLTASDVLLKGRRIERLDHFFQDPNQVLGRVAKKALQQGEVLTARNLSWPALVSRRDVVSLVVRGKHFTVSTLARARDAGFLGDRILVENLDSRKTVLAKIVGDKKVEVDLP